MPTTITFFPVDNGDMTLIKFGDLDATTLLIDRLMHHGHLLKFEGKSWRLKEAESRIAKHASAH